MSDRANTFDAAAARTRCKTYRRRILDMSQNVSALHIGGAFSCTEIVDCIYNGLMRTTPNGKTSPDTFLMSKGHGCMIQYVILEDLGILAKADLDAYCTPGGQLGVHPDYGNPGIEASTGALGHGLSMVVGMALAERGARHRRHHLHGAERRRGAGRLDLGGDADGVLARARPTSSPSSTTTTSRASGRTSDNAPLVSIRWPTSSAPSAGRRSRSTGTIRRRSLRGRRQAARATSR